MHSYLPFDRCSAPVGHPISCPGARRHATTPFARVLCIRIPPFIDLTGRPSVRKEAQGATFEVICVHLRVSHTSSPPDPSLRLLLPPVPSTAGAAVASIVLARNTTTKGTVLIVATSTAATQRLLCACLIVVWGNLGHWTRRAPHSSPLCDVVVGLVVAHERRTDISTSRQKGSPSSSVHRALRSRRSRIWSTALKPRDACSSFQPLPPATPLWSFEH